MSVISSKLGKDLESESCFALFFVSVDVCVVPLANREHGCFQSRELPKDFPLLSVASRRNNKGFASIGAGDLGTPRVGVVRDYPVMDAVFLGVSNLYV